MSHSSVHPVGASIREQLPASIFWNRFGAAASSRAIDKAKSSSDPCEGREPGNHQLNLKPGLISFRRPPNWLPNQLTVLRTMPNRRPTDNVPDPANGQIPVEDCLAVKPLGRVQLDNLRKQLTVIRGEILESAEQGSQHGLVDVKREIAKLARIIQQLEILLTPE